ncbi:NMD3 family protein [Pyrolobus fumarii 1A]|uniref:NMD3 family protein n=1 Tax=Pyrolobus fumarii (strain DSM 11204 / 1A) TaxID=694429 RepID=G0EGT1_PYRF1|nr:NMD3 family protein [Pyrolobus fumarii 1A]
MVATRLDRCIRCGRRIAASEPVIDGMCLECFLEERKLVEIPGRLDFEYCRSCGAIRYGYRWVEQLPLEEASRRYLELYLSERVKPAHALVEDVKIVNIEPLQYPSWRSVYRVVVEARLKGVEEPVRQEYVVEVRAVPSLCPACKNDRGGDYNVLVQVRGRIDAKLVEVLGRILDSGRVAPWVVDIIEDKRGIDILLRDRGAASRIVSELSKYFVVDVKRSAETVGMTSTGIERRRLTISVRVKRPR